MVEDSESRDPSVDLALAGWAILRCDGLTDRVNADVPDDFTDASVVRRFARAHDAGSVVIARHPSGETLWSTDPQQFTFGESESE